MVIFVGNRSLRSIPRRQVIVSGSMSNRTNLHRRAAPAVSLVPAHARLKHHLAINTASRLSRALLYIAMMTA